jgi:hypothetical protein
MTEGNARTVANVLVGVAGVAAAYVVLTTPSLRRLAVRTARVWLGGSVPIYLLTQVGRAWVESSRAG